MSWNHRVMRRRDPDGTPVLTIHEVYYREDGSIKGWIEHPATPLGTTIKELHGDAMRFERAFTRHILDVRADGDELYDVGLTGRTRSAPACVFKRSDQPQAAVPDPQESR